MRRHLRIQLPPASHADAQLRQATESGRWPREWLFQDPAFPFTIIDNPNHPSVPFHAHEGFAELVIVYGGEGTHLTHDGAHPVQAGDVFVLTEDMAHGYRDTVNLDLLNVVFDPDRLLTSVQDIKKIPGYHALFHLEPRYRARDDFESRLRLAPDDLAHALSLSEELARLTLGRPRGYEFITRAVFMELVWFLCQCYEHRSHPKAKSLTLMGEVISYLERHYAEEIDLAGLAVVAGTSERNLLLLFREATGRSPIDYLIRLRMGRACELLCTTTLTVTAIADLVGFNDSNYFTRQFRQTTGTTPTAYRKRFAPHAAPYGNREPAG